MRNADSALGTRFPLRASLSAFLTHSLIEQEPGLSEPQFVHLASGGAPQGGLTVAYLKVSQVSPHCSTPSYGLSLTRGKALILPVGLPPTLPDLPTSTVSPHLLVLSPLLTLLQPH